MVNKCAVFGCKRGYESEEPQHEDYHAFYFPLDERKSHLLPAWEKFVCRDGRKPSANSVICEFHFEDRLIRKGKRWTLKWKLNPMPTMLTDEMNAMPQSVQLTPAAPPRKPPAKRTYQEDEINAFLSQDIIGDFSELNSTHAQPGFQCTKSDNSIVFFNLTYVDGFPVIFESIKVDQSLHVQLQFNGHPVPLPAWFTKGRNATLTRFSQLNNFPNAIRVVSEETECSRSLLNEMLDISNYQAKGRPPYSSAMIRFALHLRYTSLQSYKLFLLCLVSIKLKLLNRLLIRVAKKFPLLLRVTSPKNWQKGLIATVVNRYLLQVQWTWQKTITSTFLVADPLSHLQNWLSILAIVLRSWITHTTSFKHTVSGMCGQHILKFLIGFLPRLTFVVQNITIGD